ncbi:MAG: hypothetical protein MUC49_22410 [Raineya sp.]|jgi:hypothetical protein|nr:hypothetical protein [Raineya sp.]
MRKVFVIISVVMGLVIPKIYGQQLDSLRLRANIKVKVDPLLKEKHPTINWDSVAKGVETQARNHYTSIDYLVTEDAPESVTVMGLPCFEEKNENQVDGKTITVGFLNEAEDCNQTVIDIQTKKLNIIYTIFLNKPFYLTYIHKRLEPAKKKPNARPYNLTFKFKNTNGLEVPFQNGLYNAMGERSWFIQDNSSNQRIIQIKMKKKGKQYVIKMDFSSKTDKLLFAKPSKEGNEVVKKIITIPLKPTKEDVWKASAELNENTIFFLKLNEED